LVKNFLTKYFFQLQSFKLLFAIRFAFLSLNI
jgi:hypothetical protein